jgi:hypothetical protein
MQVYECSINNGKRESKLGSSLFEEYRRKAVRAGCRIGFK